MPILSWTILLLIALGSAGIVALLYSAARTLHFHRQLHELTVDSHRLRLSQIKRLAELRGSDAWEAAELVIDPLLAGAIQAEEEEMKKAA